MKRVRFGPTKQPAKPILKSSKPGVTKSYKKRVKKPQWDDTVSDLTVHRPSKHDLDRRRRSAQSKNVEAARHDLYERAKGSVDLDSSGNLRPSPSTSSSKMAGLQRALHGKELHEVLAESDRALAVVKDLFGDDPKRYVSQPNVTVAPHVINDKKSLERTLLESQRGGPSPTAQASPGGIRDQSVLELAPQKPALNELTTSPPPELNLEDGSDSVERDDDDTLTAGSQTPPYRPSIDLQRFQKLVHHEQPSAQTKTSSDRSPPPHTLQSLKQPNTDRKEAPRTVDEESITGLSEISSIPADPDATVNTANATVDSEMSTSIYSTLLQALPQLNPAQQSSPQTATQPSSIQITVNESMGERASNELQRGMAANLAKTQPAHAHPLQISHKMATAPGDAGGGSTQARTRKPSSSYTAAVQSRNQETERPLSDLQNLEKLVQELELELSEYEKTTGYSQRLMTTPSTSTSSQQPGTLSGITASLLASVARLTHYLRQSEVQLRGEVAVRGQLLHTMTEQQNLMDALTTDVVKLRKDNEVLGSELKKVKKKCSEDMRSMQDDLSAVHKKLSTLALQQSTTSGTLIPTQKQQREKLIPRAAEKLSEKSYKANHPPAVPQTQPISSRGFTGVTTTQALPTGKSLQPSPVVPATTGAGVIYAQVSPLSHSDYHSTGIAASAGTSLYNTLGGRDRTNAATTPVYTSALHTAKHHTFVPLDSFPSDHLQSATHRQQQQLTYPQSFESVDSYATDTCVSTSPSNYAPSPPPLSIALQVPDFSLTPTDASSSNLLNGLTSNLTSAIVPQYLMHSSASKADSNSLLPSSQSTNRRDDRSSRNNYKPDQIQTCPTNPHILQCPDLSMSSIPEPSQQLFQPQTDPPLGFHGSSHSIQNIPELSKSILGGLVQQRSSNSAQHIPKSILGGNSAPSGLPLTATFPHYAGSATGLQLFAQPSTETVFSTRSEGFEVVTSEAQDV